MKKTIFIFCLLSLIMAVVFIGCSDDDESVIAAAEAQGYIISQVNLSASQLQLYFDFFPLGSGFDIDSIKIEDTMAIVQSYDQTYWWSYGDDNYSYAYLNSFGSGYTEGDTVEMTVYHTNGATSAMIELLNRNDVVNMNMPIDNDTASLGTNVEFHWNSFPGTDWYGLYQYGYFDSSGTQVYRYQYIGIKDTTITFPSSQNTDDGYLDTYIVAVSGPGPNDNLNINGAGVVGELHSVSDYSLTRVYLGTGDPSPTSSDTEYPTIDPSEVRDKILNHFRAYELRKPENQ